MTGAQFTAIIDVDGTEHALGSKPTIRGIKRLASERCRKYGYQGIIRVYGPGGRELAGVDTPVALKHTEHDKRWYP